MLTTLESTYKNRRYNPPARASREWNLMIARWEYEKTDFTRWMLESDRVNNTGSGRAVQTAALKMGSELHPLLPYGAIDYAMLGRSIRHYEEMITVMRRQKNFAYDDKTRHNKTRHEAQLYEYHGLLKMAIYIRDHFLPARTNARDLYVTGCQQARRFTRFYNRVRIATDRDRRDFMPNVVAVMKQLHFDINDLPPTVAAAVWSTYDYPAAGPDISALV